MLTSEEASKEHIKKKKVAQRKMLNHELGEDMTHAKTLNGTSFQIILNVCRRTNKNKLQLLFGNTAVICIYS